MNRLRFSDPLQEVFGRTAQRLNPSMKDGGQNSPPQSITLNATLMRMETSGKQILDAKPANEKPDIPDDEVVEKIRGND